MGARGCFVFCREALAGGGTGCGGVVPLFPAVSHWRIFTPFPKIDLSKATGRLLRTM